MNKMKEIKALKFYSEDPDVVCNRENKSLLVVFTMYPHLLLNPEVSHPDKVRYLIIDCDPHSGICRKNYSEFENTWQDAYENRNIYTPTLLKDLIHFHNIEIFNGCSIRLDMRLWQNWALNCCKLKEINLTNHYPEQDFFRFDQKTIETIFKIPTLRTVKIENIELPFFPQGPSNVEKLALIPRSYLIDFDKNEYHNYSVKEMIESYSKNLCTHKNLKNIRIEKFTKFFIESQPLLNVAKNCINLEEIYLDFIDLHCDDDFGDNYGDEDYEKSLSEKLSVKRANVIEQLLQLPKLKACTLVCSTSNDVIFNKPLSIDKLIMNSRSIFPSITHLKLLKHGNLSAEFTGAPWKLTNSDIIAMFKQFPNLKSCLKDDKELIVN